MSDEEEAPDLDLSNPSVITKYKDAADIANGVMQELVTAARDGARILDLCEMGDSGITTATSRVYKGKTIEKGIAFPTCVSVNSVIGHFSPTSEDSTVLHDGDVVKIDLGVHIDGFIATAAQTLVVQSDTDAVVTGRTADALAAAALCFEAALRLMRPGKKISDVSAPLQQIAEEHGVTLVEGVLSHQLKQFVIDGNKCVLNKPTPEAKVEEGEFAENEVYAIDIVVSTGEGKAKVLDEKETTVYKRALDVSYNLKLKASRAVFSEINKRFPAMPFTIRGLEGQQSKLGLVECLSHGLLHPYPVLHEKTGEVVVQTKGTVLLLPNGSDRVTSAGAQRYRSEKVLTDEGVKELLATSIKKERKKKPRKKKDDASGEAQEVQGEAQEAQGE